MGTFTKNPVAMAVGLVGLIAVFGLVVWWAGGFENTVPANSQGAAAAGTFPPTDDFAVLASTYTNTGATTITGDLGYTTGPGVPPTLIGTEHVADGAYDTAGTAQGTTLSSLNAESCDFNYGSATDLSLLPQPLAAGVYCITGAASVGTGGITLSDAGTYIFRIVGALNTVAGSVVTVNGFASACDVFWTPTEATTLGANSTFRGTNIDAAGITIGSTVNWTGRALAFGGTITSNADTITAPTCDAPVPPTTATLNVIKQVVNDGAGTATASDWTLTVTSSNGGTGTGSAVGAGSPGTAYTLQEGKQYSVAESGGPAGYDASSSSGCTIASAVAGTTYACTITNDDTGGSSSPSYPNTGSINVVKVVINDNGGTKTIADFPLFVNGVPVISGVTKDFPAPADAYAVTETFDPNYTRTYSGGCDVNGRVNIVAGDYRLCVVTNDDKGVPVAVPPVPPLIEVVKVPSPLALPAGPGSVVYTYTIRNMGTVPMSNVTMVGDTCSPIVLVSGDTNADAKLDVNETWVHTCSTRLTKTHTNTVVATGWAGGISAVDIASATVVVGAPIVPPLIHVTKVPSALTLLAGGGMITYTYTVTNPGTAALHTVSITDDKCTGLPGRVAGHPGDLNKNNLLESGEAWSFTCQTNLTRTTTNTGTAEGSANGFIARDFAIATVVVAVPSLPNTGLRPE